MITITTIGYGDVLPTTAWGKVCASLIGFIGVCVTAVPIGIIGSQFVEALDQEKELRVGIRQFSARLNDIKALQPLRHGFIQWRENAKEVKKLRSSSDVDDEDFADKFIEKIKKLNGKANELDGRKISQSDREDIATEMGKLVANVFRNCRSAT
jgi:hypothetical protein